MDTKLIVDYVWITNCELRVVNVELRIFEKGNGDRSQD